MSKRNKKTNSSFWLKVLSALLLLLSFLGLLGAFGLSIGKPVDALFTGIMGGLAWAGPFLCFVIGILLWIYSSTISAQSSSGRSLRDEPKIPQNSILQRRERKSRDPLQDPNAIPLPAGKIVSLRGFNQYFASPDWVEMMEKNVQVNEELKEIGKDFPSYFGTGESVFVKKRSNLTSLKGLNDYFLEVDQEERLSTRVPEKKPPVPVLSRQNPEPFSTVFKSKSEQEEFLAQFKDDETHFEERVDFVEDLRDDTSVELDAEIVSENEAVILTAEEPESCLETYCRESSEQVYEDEVRNKDLEALEDLEVLLELETACTTETMSEPPASVTEELDSKSDSADQSVQILDTQTESVRPWEFPQFDLLDPLQHRTIIQDTETSKQLEKVLLDFGVKAKLIRVTRGPVITRYELAPAPGVKISKIVNLSDDIALALAARDVRIEAPIPGKAAIGIEVPNKQALSVPFREVLETSSFRQQPSKLKVALGKDISDQPVIADLIKMPHLLVAGATGSGKSVCITTIINSILFNASPDEVKLLLVDPKMVELSQYNGIPHLLAPVVIDPKKAASALKWIVKEMENRYELFAASGVRDIERYNRLKSGETSKNTPALPFVVVIIDELADLMMVAAGEVEEAICRLAQMARAAGIHLVIATQRPSVDVITGVIKANIPSRISFAVSSQIDSRTILDATGAEKLLGRGDMLYSPLGMNKALRVQGCLVTDEEVQRIITHWKELGKPEYLDPEKLFEESTVKNEESNGPDDALFLDAGQLFIRTGMASVSFLQRRLKLGYTRAARLMDMLEEQGIVGAYEGSKPRQVLLTLEEFNERFG